MGFDLVTCGGSNYFTITCCGGNLISADGSAVVAFGLGPVVRHNNQTTDYALHVGAASVPIVKTTRNWTSTIESSLGQPTGPVRVIQSGGQLYSTFCDPFTLDVYTTAVSEDCCIEKSTIHFLDLRYGVCLYRSVKEHIIFSKEVTGNPGLSGAVSPSMSRFQGPYGLEMYWKIALASDEAIADCVEEWVLIDRGVKTVLASTAYTKTVLNDRIISSVACGGEDAVGEILLFPAPGMYSNPVDCDVSTFGWYKSGVQAGNVNYYYPDWCKALHLDPVWAAAELARESYVFDHTPLPPTDTAYQPPPVTVDPIPVGSFVRHPVLGSVYQWLVSRANGSSHLASSHNFNTLLDSKLPVDSTTHGTTLYSPLSLV